MLLLIATISRRVNLRSFNSVVPRFFSRFIIDEKIRGFEF